MYTVLGSRKQLLDVIQSRGTDGLALIEQSASRIRYEVQNDELLFVWADHPTPSTFLPDVICTASGKTRDFLAWASTYLGPLTPFTAFSHVMPTDELARYLKQPPSRTMFPREDPFIGAIVGELLALRSAGYLKSLTVLDAQGTLSYTFARAAMLGLQISNEEIASRYESLRMLMKNNMPIAFFRNIREIWENILVALGPEPINLYQGNEVTYSPYIRQALYRIGQGDQLSDSLVAEILRRPPAELTLPKFDVDVETRVKQFESISGRLVLDNKIHPQSRAFLIAYLANQVSPGTLDHYRLLDQYSHILPTTQSWYGVIAGFVPNNGLMFYEYGLGFRISRKIRQASLPLERPSCDIAVNELDLLVSFEKTGRSFRPESSSTLTVEIAPGINTTMPWPTQPQPLGTASNHEQSVLNFRTQDNVDSNLTKIRNKLIEVLELLDKQTKYSTLDDSASNQKRKGSKGRMTRG
jgi:hypothetical protein